jgi:hypothetical protein
VQQWTEAQLKEELQKFKGLTSAYQIASSPALSGTYLADYLLCEPDFVSELTSVDVALLCLQKRISDARMQPILSKLFERLPTDKGILAWDQAVGEILAIAHCESLGILHSIGWPSDFPGQHAPFDFAIKIQGIVVAGDVKPANGSGYRLLVQLLRRCVSEQAAQRGIANPPVTVRYRGPLTQEVVGSNLQQVLSDFKSKIAGRPLSEPQTVVLPIGSMNVTVILGDTEVLDGGITGTSALSDTLAPTFKRHIENKGSQGSKYDVCFFLAYVRLPDRGSADLKTHASFGDALAKAVSLLGRPTSDWLGILFLRPGTQNGEPRFFENSQAIWPGGISAEAFSQGLGAMLIPLPRFLEDIHEGKQRFDL